MWKKLILISINHRIAKVTGRDHRFAHVHAEDGRSLRCIFLPRAKNYLSPAEEDAGFDLISPAEMQAQIFEIKGGDSLKHG
jgi:hypothetical protein